MKKLIINQMNMILIRMNQSGNISDTSVKQCINIVEQCLTFEDHLHQKIFKSYINLKYIPHKLYNWRQATLANRNNLQREPNKLYRVKLNHLLRNPAFPIIIVLLTICSMTTLLLSLFINKLDSSFSYAIITLNEMDILIMSLLVYIYINSYSVFDIKQGTVIYFRSVWHRIEAVMLAFSLIDLIVVTTLYLQNNTPTWSTYKYVRLVKLVQISSAVKMLPLVLSSMEDILMTRIALSYEIAKAIYDAYSELQLSIDVIFEDRSSIVEDADNWIREDKKQLYQIFMHVQLNYPNVARRVKTYQVMNTIITALYRTLADAKSSGYLDLWEFMAVKDRVRKCEISGNAMRKFCQDMRLRDILHNVNWIGHNKILLEYLLFSCTVITLKEGEVLCKPGGRLNGIYIILSGTLKLEFTPNATVASNLDKHGLLPVTEHIDPRKYLEPFELDLLMGNIVGKSEIATNRPCDFTLTSIQASKVYYINLDNLKVVQLCVADYEKYSFVEHMWKVTYGNIATAILKSIPKYEYFTQHEIRLKLDAAFVPDLSPYKSFTYLDAIDDLILLNGIVKDYYSDHCFIAPCHLPRSLIKFHLHITKLDDESQPNNVMQTRLLVIPMADIDQHSLMLLENEVAERYSSASPLAYTSYASKQATVTFIEDELEGITAFATSQAGIQGHHLTKFINLKK